MEQPRPGDPGRAAPGLPGHRGRPGGPLTGGLAVLGPFFAVGVHPAAAVPAPPWRPAGELLRPSGTLVRRIAQARAVLAGRGGVPVSAVEPRVAASAVQLGLAARLTAPALGAAVLGGPLDLDPGGLWWQDTAGGPVPLSVPEPARRAGPDLDWPALLLDEALAPLTAAVQQLVPVSDRVLRGNAASGINTAARLVAAQRPDLAGAAWQAAARLFAHPWLRGEPSPPGPAFRRSSCCLFYRLAPGEPSAVCGDCVLTARPAHSPRLKS